MGFDPELLKQLIETFKLELEEQLQVITDGLLQLEKTPQYEMTQTECIQTIFRAAHNIKGAARSLNINDVADIAHHVESLFASLQKKLRAISPAMVNLCFEAVDKMRLAMQFFLENQTISFNLNDLLARLDKGESEQIEKEKPVATEIKPESPAFITERRATPIEPIGHETIRVSIANLDRIAALMEEMQVNKIAIDEHHEELAKLAANTKQLTELWQQTQVEKNNNSLTDNNENLQKFYNISNDHLMEINHTVHRLHTNMHQRINELNGLSHSLQEEVRMLRLIPAANLLQSLPRAVRDLANEMNKKVELLITGDDVKMDKMVLENLKNPIIHLLRNAIDHGIEDPSLRKAQGKPEVGKIWLDVIEEGNQILLRIKDDGAGININKIAELSEKKNLVSTSELKNLSETDILELIFRPGFSTKEIITQVSGRGVGLNVVKENITKLKGQVSVTTELGKGTAFDLRVPLTIAGERGLIVSSGGQLFVIPSACVEKVLSLQANAIIEVGASQAILLDTHPVPLRTLADDLN